MTRIVFITPSFAVAPQLGAEDFVAIAQAGFKAVINNRPEGEEEGQLPSPAAEGLFRCPRCIPGVATA